MTFLKLVSKIAGPLHAVAALGLLVTGRLLSWSLVVIAAQVAAVALSVWARASFAPGQFSVFPEPRTPGLIERGPYRWIRHPMYTSAETIVWSGVLSHLSPVTVAVGLTTFAAMLIRVPDEEKLLRERVPGYAEYAARTKRFIPFVF